MTKHEKEKLYLSKCNDWEHILEYEYFMSWYLQASPLRNIYAFLLDPACFLPHLGLGGALRVSSWSEEAEIRRSRVWKEQEK